MLPRLLSQRLYVCTLLYCPVLLLHTEAKQILPRGLVSRISELGYHVLTKPAAVDIGSMVIPGNEKVGGRFQLEVLSSLFRPTVETNTVALKHPFRLMRLRELKNYISLPESLRMTKKDAGQYLFCNGLTICTLKSQPGLTGATFSQRLSQYPNLSQQAVWNGAIVISSVSLNVETIAQIDPKIAAAVSAEFQRTVWAYRAGRAL
jgi:hypothetical protein